MISNEVPDSAIKIYGNNWVATVLAGSPSPDGIIQIYCTTTGATPADAMTAATFVLNAFAHGRQAMIRCAPEARSETDFDTKITNHLGFVRFSYKLESGEWTFPEHETSIPMGFIQ